MTTLPYFENLGQMIKLFDDELLAMLLVRVELELGARGKSDARCYLARARACLEPAAPRSTPAGEAPRTA